MPKGQTLQWASGSYTGTGSAVNVDLGFKPILLLIFNVTDGDVLFCTFDGLSAGAGLKIDTATAALATNGLTLRNNGFTAGSDCSESAKSFRYLAIQG